ncbi:MAG: PspC domain-containing protein [Calditrichaeota bacterium]|nr:PspC domain-containing protein [Calditrichota bacterium]
MIKLYRSKQDRYLGGLAGGLGAYFRIDSNIFRILFIITTFTGGIGLIVYLVGLFIIPENPGEDDKSSKLAEKNSNFILAVILIILGLFLLSREIGWFDYLHFWQFPWTSIWAVFLIIIGVLLIFSGKSRDENENSEKRKTTLNLPDINKIYRSRENRMIAGVCGGIAEYVNIDPSIVRLLWVFASFASIGLGILVYIILIFVFQEKPEEVN